MNTTLCSLQSIRTLALPVANSTLQERQFYIFLETNQAAKKTGKRRTASEKNSTFASSGSTFRSTEREGRYEGGREGRGAGAGAYAMTPQPAPSANL
jgi:hypothetical protein